MEYKGELYAYFGGKYFKISHTDVIYELKRLQKEIDEAEEIENQSVIDNWGKRNDDKNPPDYQSGFEAYEIKQKALARIKQIIEQL